MLIPPSIDGHASLLSAHIPHSTVLSATTPFHLSGLQTGLLCYVGGFLLLTAWEEVAVPRLKRRGIIPDIPFVEGALTEEQKDASWILPWFNSGIEPPKLEELQKMHAFRVGQRSGADQFITVHKPLRPIK